MPISNFPNGFANGVLIRGVPIAITNPGETFWVNSTTILPEGGRSPSDNSPGTFQEPVATIGAALDLCKASRGDIIAVMPGYTEDVTGAAGLAFDVAGVAVIGMGQGALKPTISSTATGSTITVTANNVSITNVRFKSTVANVAKGLDVTGTHFAVDSCEFMADLAAEDMQTPIDATATATGLRVTNCKINQESTVGGLPVTGVPVQGIKTLADNSYIVGNHINGAYSVSGILNTGTAAEGLVIDSNIIYNPTTTLAEPGISLASGCTGIVNDNYVGSLDTSSIDDCIDNASASPAGNLACNVITETGGPLGTAAT